MMKMRLFLLSAVFYIVVGSSFGQVPSMSAPRGYLIGPGDVLSIKALGEKDFDADGITVEGDGKITLPWVNTQVVAKLKNGT